MVVVSSARVIIFGLGPIGVGIAEVALEHGHQIIGAVDIDPAKAGRPLSEVVRGAGDVTIERTIDPLLNAGAEVVLHSTQSHIDQVMPQLVPLLDAGLNVISTCEELAYPWHHHPKDAALLDQMAKERGARVIGVGVNPGFVMDAGGDAPGVGFGRLDDAVEQFGDTPSGRARPIAGQGNG